MINNESFMRVQQMIEDYLKKHPAPETDAVIEDDYQEIEDFI